MSKKSVVKFIPAHCEVEIDGLVVGKVQYEDDKFVVFDPDKGYCLGAYEMLEIGQKMKEMEKE